MSRAQFQVVALKVASPLIGLKEDTLRKAARSGQYPSTVMKKVGGSWMVDIEEWNKWHRDQM